MAVMISGAAKSAIVIGSLPLSLSPELRLRNDDQYGEESLRSECRAVRSMKPNRVEKDLLGSYEIPADAYYGVHTGRALDNFSISRQRIYDFPDLIRGMAMVKKAAAITNAGIRQLPDDVATAIIVGCDLLLSGKHHDQFPIDAFQGGAGTSVNMNTNEVVANLALESLGLEKGRYDIIDPNDHVNKCQSTNDVYPTALRLAAFRSVERLQYSVEDLAYALDVKSREFDGIVKMGRTQLQDAVPMTLGQEFHGFAVNVKEELRSLEHATSLLLKVNLGGTAIGTSVNAPDRYVDTVVDTLHQVSGIPVTSAVDLVGASSDNGALVHLHSAIKRVAIKVSQMCNDLRLLSSGPRAGLNEINLPEMQAGSSIMPAKVNPVIPEVVNQVAFKVIGNDMTVTMAAESGQLQLNAMEPVLVQALFESVELLANACSVLTERCIRGITANIETCRDHVQNSIGMVTLLNNVIGHRNGDLVGREAARSNRSVREVVLAMGLLDEARLDQLLSVDTLVEIRSSEGMSKAR